MLVESYDFSRCSRNTIFSLLSRLSSTKLVKLNNRNVDRLNEELLLCHSKWPNSTTMCLVSGLFQPFVKGNVKNQNDPLLTSDRGSR